MPLLTTQSAKGYGFGKFEQAGYATGNFVSLQTAYGTGSNATITFSAIPQTFKHLRIFALHKGTAGSTNTQGLYTMQFNSDTGSNSNYNSTQQVGSGSGSNQVFNARVNSVNAFFGSSSFYYNTLCSASNTGSGIGVSVIDIPDYTNTSHYKTFASFDGKEIGNNDGNSRLILSTGSWNSTSAVTDITFKIYDENITATNFTSTSRFALYGITR